MQSQTQHGMFGLFQTIWLVWDGLHADATLDWNQGCQGGGEGALS